MKGKQNATPRQAHSDSKTSRGCEVDSSGKTPVAGTSNGLPRKAAKPKHEPPEFRTRKLGDGTTGASVVGDRSRLVAGAKAVTVGNGLISQLIDLYAEGNQLNKTEADFALGFVHAMKPNDPAETLLLTQMAAIHQASLSMAYQLKNAKMIQHQDSAERALNKLTRTYTTQMEALKRYRATAQQTVRVERVEVREGGQAVVGNVSHGGGNDKET